MLLTSFALAMFIANPILSGLSDHYGRRLVLFVLAVSAAAHLWFALSSDIWSMFAARMCRFRIRKHRRYSGHDRRPDVSGKAGRCMGLLGAAIGVGCRGPALGGLLSHVGSGPVHQAPFLLAAAFSRCAADDAATEGTARQASRPATGGYALQARIIMMVALRSRRCGADPEPGLCGSSVLCLVLRDYLGFGARETGWLFTYVGVCIVLVQAVLIRHMVKRLGEVGTMGFGSLLLIIGQALTVLAAIGLLPGGDYPLVQTVIATTAICFGFALASPALSSAASKIAGSSSRGGSLGVVQGFASLGQVIRPSPPDRSTTSAAHAFAFGVAVMIGLLALLPWLARPEASADISSRRSALVVSRFGAADRYPIHLDRRLADADQNALSHRRCRRRRRASCRCRP